MATTSKRVRTLIVLAATAVSLVLVAPSPASAAGTTITLDAPEGPVLTYETTQLQGMVSPGGSTSRVVLQRQVGGAWHDLTSAVPDPTGAFEVPLAVKEAGDYLLRVRSLHGTVVSDEIDVLVVRHPTEIHANASPFDPTVGQRVRVSGYVVEPGATPRVVVQRQVAGGWSDRQAGPVDAKGRFSIVIQPSQSGPYTLRVRSAGGSKWSAPFQIWVAPQPVPVAT